MKPFQSRYQKAANKYRPWKTRVLFVAEAPPLSVDRYFYFEDVRRDDWLWIALMKRLFTSEWGETRHERKWKRYWLLKFQKNNYQLIDSVKTPIAGSSAARSKLIRARAPQLISEIRAINPKRIILITATVHQALVQELEDAGLHVINSEALPFPASGHQTEFHRSLRCEWFEGLE